MKFFKKYQKFQNIIFFIFLHIVYDIMFVSARNSPWAVPFGSYTSLKSESGYQCLIRRVIDHYGQFQNGRHKIHGFSRNVLLNMVFLNFASQARFECLILHFIVDQVFTSAGMWYLRHNPRWLPEMIKKMFKNSHFLANILEAHVLPCKKTTTIGVIWFRDNPWVKIIWLVLDL